MLCAFRCVITHSGLTCTNGPSFSPLPSACSVLLGVDEAVTRPSRVVAIPLVCRWRDSGPRGWGWGVRSPWQRPGRRGPPSRALRPDSMPFYPSLPKGHPKLFTTTLASSGVTQMECQMEKGHFLWLWRGRSLARQPQLSVTRERWARLVFWPHSSHPPRSPGEVWVTAWVVPAKTAARVPWAPAAALLGGGCSPSFLP